MTAECDIRWHAYATRVEAGDAAAHRVAELLRAGLRRSDRAAMIASGGESPRALYASLSKAPVEWARVVVVPSDERCVEVTDPASNAGMIRTTLLRAAAKSACLVSLYDAAALQPERLIRSATNVAALPRPFAVTVLGLGEDGHTASLFPDARDIADQLAADADVVAVQIPRLPQARVSLTPRALLDTAEICVLFFGDAKRYVYETALAVGRIATLPIRLVLHQTAAPVSIFWAP